MRKAFETISTGAEAEFNGVDYTPNTKTSSTTSGTSEAFETFFNRVKEVDPSFSETEQNLYHCHTASVKVVCDELGLDFSTASAGSNLTEHNAHFTYNSKNDQVVIKRFGTVKETEGWRYNEDDTPYYKIDLKSANFHNTILPDNAPFEVIYSTTHNMFVKRNKITGQIEYKKKDDMKFEISKLVGRPVSNNDVLAIPHFKVAYKPYLKDSTKIDGEDFFNSFKSTVYLSLTKTDAEVMIPKHLDLLINNLFPREEERHHFLNWCANMVQTKKKSQVAWVLISSKGTGKGLLFEVLKKILGEHNAQTVNQVTFLNGFNQWAMDKLLINPNEISTSKFDRVHSADLIKGWITEDNVEVNNKFGFKGNIENTFNLFFHSNNAIPLDMDADDRRFCLSDTRNSAHKLTDLFGCTDKDCHDFVMSSVEEFAQYLTNFPIDENLYHTALHNADKMGVAQLGKSDYEQFVEALVSGDTEYFEEWFQLGRSSIDSWAKLKMDANDGFVYMADICKLFNDMFDQKKNPASLGKLMCSNLKLDPSLKTRKANGRGITVTPFSFES